MKLTTAESPRYPREASERPAWLRARGWKIVTPGNRDNEVWQDEDGTRVQGRTNACRHALGLPPL